MTTFQILEEIRALYALMVECDENGELLHSEDDLKDFVKEIKQSKEKKLNSMQDLKIELQHSINAYDEKIAKLSARKKALENDIERVKHLQLMLLDGEKCKTDEYNFYFMATKSVNISDKLKPEMLDKEYQRVKIDFDKTAIKKALQDGNIPKCFYVNGGVLPNGCIIEDIGAELVENKSLVVK